MQRAPLVQVLAHFIYVIVTLNLATVIDKPFPRYRYMRGILWRLQGSPCLFLIPASSSNAMIEHCVSRIYQAMHPPRIHSQTLDASGAHEGHDYRKAYASDW